MRTLALGTLFLFLLDSRLAVAGVSYDEQFAAYFAQFDFPWQPTGDPSRFFDADYVTGPFDSSLAMTQHVYIKGGRLARIGVVLSAIYDLDKGTVTLLRHDKNQYAVVSFEDMLELLNKAPISWNKATVRIDPSSREEQLENHTSNEYNATILSGYEDSTQVLAHASFWNVQELPSQDVSNYRKHCLDKYGNAYAPLCSLTDPRGFGTLSTEMVKVEGYTVMAVLEARVPVPDPFHTGSQVNPGPAFARVFRAETKLSNFNSQPVDDSVFQIPAHYKRAKHVSRSWLGFTSVGN